MNEGIIAAIMLAAVLLAVAFCFLLMLKNRKSEIAESEVTEDAELLAEPEITEIRATVSEIKCEVKVWGTKTPQVIKEFCVSFVDDTGKTYDFKVPEEMYEGFEEGQVGILTLSNGNIYGFTLYEKNEL